MTVIFALLLIQSTAQATTPDEANPLEILESIPEVNWQKMHRQGKHLCAAVQDRHSLAVVYTSQPQLLFLAYEALASYTSQLETTYARLMRSLRYPHPYEQEGRQLAQAMEVSLTRLQRQMTGFEEELSSFETEFDGLIHGARAVEPRRSLLVARCRVRLSRTEAMLEQSHQLLFAEMRRVIPLMMSYDAHVSPPPP